MKIKDYPIPHPAGIAAEIAIKARTRQVTAQSFELLKLAEPDTFLGRQHYPLLPLPHEEDDGTWDRLERRNGPTATSGEVRYTAAVGRQAEIAAVRSSECLHHPVHRRMLAVLHLDRRRDDIRRMNSAVSYFPLPPPPRYVCADQETARACHPLITTPDRSRGFSPGAEELWS
jgi:hypothetical protein